MATGSSRNLYFAATIASLTGCLFGYSVGFIGGVLVLPSFLGHFHLDKLASSELASAQAGTVSIWLVGTLFGVPLGAVFLRWGRKRCLSLSALLYVLGVGLQLVPSSNLAVFDAGRLLNGLGVGAGTLVSPMYISEISTPSKRGMLLSGYQTAIQLAALAGFWAAYLAHSTIADSSSLQWQIPVAVQLIVGLSLLVGTLFIPEAPLFLARREESTDARHAVAWLRGLSHEDSDVSKELDELLAQVRINDMSQKPKQSFFEEARKPNVRRRLAVGIGLMIAQNMVGLNALNYYAPTIFMSAGFTSVSSSLFLTGFFGLIKLLSALAFMFVFVRMRGNRFWLRFGSAVCGTSMIVLALCVRTLKPPADGEAKTTVRGIVSVAMVYIFAFAFGVSLGPISWNVCSEIFPPHIKATCCATTTCVQWMFQLVIAQITPHLLASVGWVTYLVYAGFCAISLAWVSACVPETKGVPLGAPMNELFGVEPEDEETAVMEDDETTALLGAAKARTLRRDSIGFPV